MVETFAEMKKECGKIHGDGDVSVDPQSGRIFSVPCGA
jgi:hypothetical protein